MKHTHPHNMKSAFFLAGLMAFASGAAGAQTYFYSNSGSGSGVAAGGIIADGTLASIGFDIWSYDHKTSAVLSDSGLVSTRPAAGLNGAYDINIAASGLATAGPVGTTLESVTLYLYATSVNPNGAPVGFSLYDGINGSGSFIDTLSLSGPGSEDQFFSVTMTGDQFLGGFSIVSNGLGSTALLNITTELNTTDGGAYSPGISATFAPVPEPSSLALGTLGALSLLFRRRKA
jgi:hypothetical protein